MNDVQKLHNEAMDLIDQAETARRKGDIEAARQLTLGALEKETLAAAATSNLFGMEPTRSVLHRSAASLALECGDLRRAEQLVGAALAGAPPDRVADELRDLLEDIYFHRHMALRGVSLQPGEFQMSLEGAGIGFGMARSDHFVGRVTDLENLIYRTAERRLGREYREAGRRKKALADELELYISAPRAASFAVTFRLGQSEQMSLPGLGFAGDVVNDLMDAISLINEGDIVALRRHIPDEPYFVNFCALARKLAPDGTDVRSVGFTAYDGTTDRVVALSRDRDAIAIPERATSPEPKAGDDLLQKHIVGHLLEADARSKTKGIIQIVADDGSKNEIVVPRGMMSDIVRPYFDEYVEVVVRGADGAWHLETIDNFDSESGDDINL